MLVKTFYYPQDARDPQSAAQIVETRFLVFAEQGVTGATYLWNSDQTDALCSGGNQDIPTRWMDAAGVSHSDYFHQPGTSQCGSCHNGRALGLRTRQLDLDGVYADGTTNQIEHLVAAGALDAAPAARGGLADPQGSAPLADRARAYLDANCGHCHAPDQEAGATGVYLDLEHSGPGQLPLCRSTSSVDGRDRVIVPGHPEQSALLARMRSSDAFLRMPRGPTHDPDQAGIAVLSQWIAAMTPAGCP
jgi:hypothetical protein